MITGYRWFDWGRRLDRVISLVHSTMSTNSCFSCLRSTLRQLMFCFFVSSTLLTFTLVQCDFGVWISSSHMCISMADYHDWNSNHRTESPYQLMCMYNVKNIHVTLPNSLDLELTGSRYVSAFEHGCFPRPGQWTPRQHFRMQQPSAMTTWFWNCWNTLDTRTDLRFFFPVGVELLWFCIKKIMMCKDV